MEQINKNQQQQTNSLQTLSQTRLQKKDNHFELSVYSGDLTPRCMAQNVKKMQQSFPALSQDFFTIFAERLTANGYCDLRLNDAVNHVIDNCIYPTPTIAQFIAYDKTIKLYTYPEIMKLKDHMGLNNESVGKKKITDYYKAVKLRDDQKLPLYASINDIEKLNLKPWKKG